MAIGVRFQTQPLQDRGLRLGAHDLFPTRIWQAQLTANLPSLPTLVDLVEAMRREHPEPAGRSNRGGWNSVDKAVLDHVGFADLNRLVGAGIDAAMAEMGCAAVGYDVESWINVHDAGGFNFPHLHEGSYLSGCFYLSVPTGSGNLIFRDPRPGVVHSSLKGPVANGYRDVSLRPEGGLLVLFPSWLEHFVEPHQGEQQRIVIAFNAIPRGGLSSSGEQR